MRKIEITVAVGNSTYEAAKYAVSLIRYIDPEMLGQFVDYERLINQVREGLCLEMPMRIGNEVRSGELQEVRLHGETHDPVFEFATEAHTLVVRLGVM